jgi:NAD(P)-dependent dehydrogenase (short-subunit alcohol dehydrogenase family)
MVDGGKTMRFLGKTVIVTGASNGIGREIALTFAREGAKTVLADIDEEAGNQLVQLIKENGGEAVFIKTDVRSPEDICKLMEIAQNTYGALHILINNTGKGAFRSPYEITVDQWDDIINTNLRSVFLCSREAAKYIRKNKDGGSIVNIASTRALMSEPNSEAYAATKGGIVALTHALAASFSNDGITVNCISPGWIETGDYEKLTMADHVQHFSKRVGKPDDVARACLFLSAKENDFVTGTNVVVDGGMTKKMVYEE